MRQRFGVGLFSAILRAAALGLQPIFPTLLS
jgi:hypothetical protein